MNSISGFLVDQVVLCNDCAYTLLDQMQLESAIPIRVTDRTIEPLFCSNCEDEIFTIVEPAQCGNYC